MSDYKYTNITRFVLGTGNVYPSGHGSEMDDLFADQQDRSPLDWWRCDSCGHANAFKIKDEWQLLCPHCGTPIPKRYDDLHPA